MALLRAVCCVWVILTWTGTRGAVANGKHLDSVSFYGDSYVYLFPQLIQSQIPFSEDTLIDLEFKTARPDGLLTLLPATNGHLLLQLDKGRVKVSFRMGTQSAGATEFLSPVSSAKLNDLNWHYVQFSRRKEEFSLTVDGQTTTFKGDQLGDELFKLDEGALLGGPGGHRVSDLGNIPNFRGCLGHVKLNGYKVLQLTVAFQSQSLSYRTDRNCSSLFKAEQSGSPISFVAGGAFMGFTLSDPQTSLVLYFEIRTKSSNCALLYSSGSPYSNHFLLLKLVDSRLYVVISHVKGIAAGHSKLVISDGRWHRISIKLADEEFGISIDEVNEKLLDPSVKISIFLGRYLNFGGSEIYSTQAVSNSSDTGGKGFQGCLNNVVHQYKPLGLRQIDVSLGIQPGCLYQYPCSESPCSPDFECVEFGFNDYQCQCAKEGSCSDKMSADSTRSPITDRQLTERTGKITQPIDVNPLEVVEGGSQRLGWQNIYVFPQFLRFGLSNSDVRFWVAEPPEYGKLTRTGVLSHVHLFSYQDVMDGSLNYTHDSSESTRDSIELEVEFTNYSAEFFPKELQKRLPYILPIHIHPVNDPPRIHLFNGRTLRMAHGSKLDISQEQILVLDPDTQPSRVKIKILFATPNTGHFELKSAPGVPLAMISQESLMNGQVVYVQNGQLSAELVLMASDDTSDSDAVTLHVEAFHIQLRQGVNTGLRVLHGSNELITNANLSFSTNAPSQKLDIQYRIVSNPRKGLVELLNSNGEWRVTDTFNQSQIDRGAIRFRHVRENRPTDDLFKFTATVLNFTAMNVFEFRVSFIPVSLRILQQSFVLNNTREKTISRDCLFSWTYPRMTPPEETVYHITAPPKSGYLFKVLEEVGSAGRHRRLGLFSNFTQSEVNRDLIYYKLHYANHKLLRDLFQFKVITPSVTGANNPFAITYLPGDGSVQLTNRSVLVKEGSLQPISTQHLFLETRDHKDFSFTVMLPPAHGDLKLIQSATNKRTLGNGTTFTTDDIVSDRLFYKHDDSETLEDRTLLLAKPRNTVNNQVEIQFWLSFKVLLLDDNEPKRIHYGPGEIQVFHVISTSERIVRQRDLHYADVDADSKSDAIVYTFPPSDTNGGFYSARLPDIPVNIFTQKQIDNDEILFRDFGVHNDYNIPFTVSDGKFLIHDRFVVRSNGSFLTETHNTGLKLEPGRTAPILTVNLSMETNLNSRREDIVYKLKFPPKYGRIRLKMSPESSKPVEFFTQEDIDEGRVFYDHLGHNRTTVEDPLIFAVHTGDLERMVMFVVIVSNETLLRLVANNEVVVTEGGVTVISRENLEMAHMQFSPASVVYTVVESPIHGSLILDTNRRTMGKEVVDIRDIYVHKFTQFDVNSGSLQYMHGHLNQQTDRIVMNVTAGNSHLNYVKLLIRVVKNQIFLETSKLFVRINETTSVPLLPNNIRASCSYYKNYSSFVFTITDPPKHGWIENRTDLNNVQEVETFTSKDLMSGQIVYTNDGKKFWSDQFTVVAGMAVENLESPPKIVHIVIKHDNIHPPEMIRNEVLQLTSKKKPIVTITSAQLQFSDVDNAPEDLIFWITELLNGNVTYNNSNLPITDETHQHFTQQDIDDGKIGFNISNTLQETAGFNFVVKDGLHQTESFWFSIRATPVKVLLPSNIRLTVPPNAKTKITPATLRASVTVGSPEQIVFVVTEPPRYGDLLMDNRQRISRFTQLDVNLDRVSYHQNVPVTKWVAKDQFHFKVIISGFDQDSESPEERTVQITVSYAALPDSMVGKYVVKSPVRLLEGGKVVVNTSHLNVSELTGNVDDKLQMELIRPPSFGFLQFRGRDVTGELRFSQSDLQNQLLVYCHTGKGKESWTDSVTLNIYPLTEPSGKSRKNPLKLRIKLEFLIDSGNKQPFKTPIFKRIITVVRGFHYNLTKDDLFTDDPDTLPSEIVYTITQGPTNGFFTFYGDPTKPLRRFTQADINHQSICFTQDGTDREGKFIFQVSDGKFPSFNGEVRVVVEPLTLSLVNYSDVQYYQDEQHVQLNRSHLGAVSNGPNTDIFYEVTGGPAHGNLVKNGTIVKKFSQKDVDNRVIIYYPLDLLKDWDIFEFSVFNSLNRISGKSLRVTAVPQVQTHPVSVYPGKTLVITSAVLDASKLAVKTDDVPKFEVIEFPIHGWLVIVPPRKKEIFILLDEPNAMEDVVSLTTSLYQPATSAEERLRSNEELTFDDETMLKVRAKRDEDIDHNNATSFTFEELRDQRVLYISRVDPRLDHMERDKFTYRLTAKGVKPAVGTFTILVTPYYGRTPEMITQPSTRYGVTRPYVPVQPDISTDYTVAICLVSVIIVLAVLIIVVRKVRVELKRQEILKKKATVMGSSSISSSNKPDLLGTSIYSGIMTDSQLHVDTTGGNDNQSTRGSSVGRSAAKQLQLQQQPGGMMSAGRNGSSNKGVSHYSLASPYHLSSPKGTSTAAAAAGSPTSFLGPHEGSEPSPSARLITFDPGRTEIVSSIPLCRVTPLTPKPSSTCSSSSEDWRYAYHYSSSASEHDSKLSQDKLSLDRNNGSGKMRRGQKPPPKLSRQMQLKDNQYWV